ncbi:MAG: ABC transporter substrate-binding protein [Dehalococcoidales bacterium]|nr:ABC transporter substrate-binding protein [Dehalococcoidales bacterium]
MKRKFIWVVASGLVVVAMLLAACAPAPAKETAPVAPTAPVVKETAPYAPPPAVKEAAPATPTAPAAETNTVKFTLTKLDGTVVEKQIEKPKYGGMLIDARSVVILAWDEAYQAPWTLATSLWPTNENLTSLDWKRGPEGTGELSLKFADYFSPKFVIGQLAESWELADATTLIFHIRKGVRYGLNPKSEASRLMNGREFTADDVVFNIKRIYFDIPTSTMYGMLGVSRPTEVYAKDKYTVVVKAPPGKVGETFDALGGMTKMFPPEVIKKYGVMILWENVVGTGPFFLTDYVPMSSATWVRNPNYWDKDPFFPENQLPYYDTFKALIIMDSSTRLAALRTHKVDYGVPATPEDAKVLIKSNPEIKYIRYFGGLCTLMGFRMDKPELPFQDIRVRKALLMAVNNQEILDTYYSGDAWLLNYKLAPIPEYLANGWHTPYEQLPPEIKEIYTYNPVKAKQLLTEAGYPNGFKTEVVVNAAAPVDIDRLTMVKEYWRKNLNVELFLDIKDYSVFMSIYQKKTMPQMLFLGRAGMPRSMYLCRKGNMYNWAMIDDPKVEQYYNDITAAYFDPPTVDKLMKAMNLYVLGQAYYYFPPSPNSYLFWMPWVKGYSGETSMGPYQSGIHYKYVWIDQALKKSMGY